MKRLITLFFLHIALSALPLMAQQYNADETNEKGKPKKLGVRLGVNISKINSVAASSNELIDTLPAIGFVNGKYDFGYTASAVLRMELNNRTHVHTEVGGTLRGGQFKNGEIGYSRITLLYIDIPAYLSIDLIEKERIQLLVGPQFSFLINSQMYLGNEVISSFTQLPMKTLDIFAVAGLQYNGSLVGLQLTAKWGLMDINNGWKTWDADGQQSGRGKNPDEITPTIRNVGRISNFSLEFGILF